ncbi:hypothetical protein SEUCBS139899_010271 [Sporothrix eucalyptigena]|uniref:Uncharacterized protein n=1 Tax=Sporothrix eucalyptigena TaxID=1812306 RepID=A0ABP0CU05_9PEZI
MSFSFVNYEGPDVPQDPGVRTLIRRQAMRDVGLDRRARGGYGQANLRQVPVFVDELVDRTIVESHAVLMVDDQSNKPRQKKKSKGKPRRTGGIKNPTPPSSSSASASSLYTLSPPSCLLTTATSPLHPFLPASISYPDSATTEQFTLLLNLVPLTGLRLGIGKLSTFKSDLLQARNWAGSPPTSLDLGNPKLAHFITSHYADVPALRYATDCVTAQLRQVQLRSKGIDISPPRGQDPLLLYNKALRAVQAALEDDTQRLTEETLCATELLAVFELLNENVPSWMHHAGGAAQLIQIRGAHRFRSESGTALFMAHIGTTVMDAFLRNKACFLEETGWKELMRTVIREDPPLVNLQDLSVAIWSHIVTGPGKFKAVTDAIAGKRPPHEGTRETIIIYLQDDRASLLGWMERAKQLPGLRNSDFEIDEYGILFPRLEFEQGDASLDRLTRLSLWGTNIMCRILKTRLLIAMAPARFRELEEECQYLAQKIKDLEQVASLKNGTGLSDGMGGLLQTAFISQNSWIVRGVIETMEIWGQVSDSVEEGDTMIEQWKFEAWCKAIGRKMPRAAT